MNSAKNVDIRAEPTSLPIFHFFVWLALMRAFHIALDISARQRLFPFPLSFTLLPGWLSASKETLNEEV